MKIVSFSMFELCITPYYSSTPLSWDGRTWLVAKPLSIRITTENKYFEVNIKSGWVFDGGSIPDFYQIRARSLGRGLFAFTVHDAFYGICLDGNRKLADELLYSLLRYFNFGWSRAQAIYWSVRAGGSGYYKKTSEQIEENGKYVKILTHDIK